MSKQSFFSSSNSRCVPIAYIKAFFKQFWEYIYGFNGMLLCLYTAFILFSFFFTLGSSIYSIVKWFLLCICVSLVCCPIFMKVAKCKEVTAIQAASKNKEMYWRLLFFLVPLSLFLLKYIIYYPTAFTGDSLGQYKQTLSNNYDDWHPVIHTLLFFKIPLFLTGGWIGSLSLFQIILFSLSVTYALLSIKKYTNIKYALFSLAFIMLNPKTTDMAMFMLKDVAFAIGALLISTFSLHIYFTHGDWIQKPINMILFILATAVTTLLRHNGILFTMPLIIAVTVMIAPKRAIIAVLCTFAVIIGIKGPLFSALNVTLPGKRQVETTGLPMTIIGAVATYAPECLDKETEEFVYKVCPKAVWETKFDYDYGKIKANENTDLLVIEEYGASKIVMMALKCVMHSPYISFKAIFKLTDVVYTICDDCNDSRFFEIPHIPRNEYNISQQGSPIIRKIAAKISSLNMLLFPWLFMFVGSMHYMLLVSVLSKCKLNKWIDWKKILFVLPTFFYNFGTMLLLISQEDSGRFFFYTFLLMPTLLALIYTENEGREGVKPQKAE